MLGIAARPRLSDKRLKPLDIASSLRNLSERRNLAENGPREVPTLRLPADSLETDRSREAASDTDESADDNGC